MSMPHLLASSGAESGFSVLLISMHVKLKPHLRLRATEQSVNMCIAQGPQCTNPCKGPAHGWSSRAMGS